MHYRYVHRSRSDRSVIKCNKKELGREITDAEVALPQPLLRARTRRQLLKQAPVTEREKSVVGSQYDMIENSYSQHVAGLFQPSRYLDVFLARCRLSARVIVDKDHRGSAEVKSRTPYFPRMH